LHACSGVRDGNLPRRTTQDHPDADSFLAVLRMLAKRWVLPALICVVLAAGCARLPDTGVTALKVETLSRLQVHLFDHKPDIEQFRVRGPFEVRVEEDRELQLSADERVEADLYLAGHAEKAPLAIVLHGLDNGKDEHAYQAYHLASWGIHSMSLQLSREGPWSRNGESLARVVELLRRKPGLIDARIDPDRIVLVGHSYGGSSVATALSLGAPAVGGVLLDPAGIGRELPARLRKVRAPLILLNADIDVSETRGRRSFYDYVAKEVAEVSIRGAHHEDAQFPMDASIAIFGSGTPANEDLQITFVSALTAAAMSLGFTGRLDYAWASFGEGMRSGRLIDGLRK